METAAEKKITIYTQVYNTKPYLNQCISSVLSQSYANFEYILVDNGCTDGSSEVLDSFAESDKRIRLIRYEINRSGFSPSLLQKIAEGDYLTYLDSDDWWEPDYLEKLLFFSEKNNLDIACTGTVMHHMAEGKQFFRKVDKPLFFSDNSFSQGLPWYHVFFRVQWGKLIRMKCLKAVPQDVVPKVPYGGDTLWCFQFLRQANRIGIDNSVLHHYRIHKKSVSYQYNPDRFKADVYLHNDAVNFLSGFGPISARNRWFLQIVYSNAVSDTVGIIYNSSLAPADKLREYRTIALHPLTQAAYRECKDESASRSRKILIQASLYAGRALKTQDNQDDDNLRAIMQALLPRSGRVVSSANAQLFLEDQKLFDALFQDNAEMILQNLLTRMETNQAVRKYAIPEAIRALAADNPLLCQIGDTVFLRKYAGIYLMVWQDETLAALEEMTGLLLEERVAGGQEIFLQLYISLAAVLEQAPAFVYGKVKLAQFYFRQKRLPECRDIVRELEEMGLADSEELDVLRYDLEAAGL